MDPLAYLARLQRCPDDLLPDECGVQDNYYVLLRADAAAVKSYLENTGRYVSQGGAGGSRVRYDYRPGTIVVEVCSGFSDPYLSRLGAGETALEEAHIRFQRERHNMALGLYPKQKRLMTGTHPLRVMAYVLDELVRYALDERLAFCLPGSRGTAHLDDFSRIVYAPEHPPL